MIITRSAFPIILIFIYGVTCSDDNSQYLQDVRRIERGTYNYNHPPSFQYEPVPVAVVYDDENIPVSKTIKSNNKEHKLSNSEEQEDKITAVVEVIEINSTVSSVTEVVTEGINLQHTRKELKLKGRAFNNLQIPVAVVYETETRRLRSNEELSVKPKSRHQRQRKTTHKANVEKVSVNDFNNKNTKIEEQQVTTEKGINKNFKERVDITTNFPKRTKELDPVVPILESESYVFSHNGNFHYSYEGGDGTKAFERGELKTFDDDSKGEAVVGSYSYTDKDGKDFSLSYTADENGYRPVGAHLPTPPPIPPAIARALKYLATKKPDSDEPVTKSYL